LPGRVALVSEEKEKTQLNTGDAAMKLKNKDFFASKPLRHTALCIGLAAALVLPAQSQAGWFSNAKTKVSHRTETVTHRVAAAPAKAKDRLEDVQNKLNEIYSHIEENRPLADKLRDSKMVDTVKETLTFIQDQRADYQQFADQGVYGFRLDMKDLLTDFTSMGHMLGRRAPVLDRLEKATALIDKMPTSFLYVMNKAIGTQLQNLQEQTGAISDKFGVLEQLPPLQELYRNPTSYTASVCPLVNDAETKATVAVLKARLANIGFVLETIQGYLPDDLMVDVDVLAGGGTTIGKFPAQIPFKVMSTVVKGISLRLDHYTSIAGALDCKTGG
jgi:hypothetical protein